MARYEPWMIAVDWCFRTMPYNMQLAEHISNDPPRMVMGRKLQLPAIIPVPLDMVDVVTNTSNHTHEEYYT